MSAGSAFWLSAILDSISELLSPLLEDGGVSGASLAFTSLGGDRLHSSRAVCGRDKLRLTEEGSPLLTSAFSWTTGSPSIGLSGELAACFSNCGGEDNL